MRLKEPLKHVYWLTESLYRAHTANQSKYYWKTRSEVQEMLERLDRLRHYQEAKTLPSPVRDLSRSNTNSNLKTLSSQVPPDLE